MNTQTPSDKPGFLDKAQGCITLAQNGCIGLLINIFLLAFLAWGVAHAYSSWQLVSTGRTATGVVVALSESRHEGDITYSPVVEFTVNGKTISFESGNSSNPPTHKVGDPVEVIYDPESPQDARIHSFYELWLFPILIIPSMLITMLIINGVFVISLLRGKPAFDG